MTDYSFVDCRISKENIGEHDADNRFMMEPFERQMDAWKAEHPGCTPIGICYDDEVSSYGCYPMVFEDANGNRYYTHWDIKTYQDYKREGLV